MSFLGDYNPCIITIYSQRSRDHAAAFGCSGTVQSSWQACALYWGLKKHIGISILWGYPYLNGLRYERVYMGHPYPNFCLCAFLAPYRSIRAQNMHAPDAEALSMQASINSSAHFPPTRGYCLGSCAFDLGLTEVHP